METLEKIYKEIILNSTQYSGEKKKRQKILSASQLLIDPIAWRLKYEHGVIERDNIGQNTIGSLLQLGIDECVDKYNKKHTEIHALYAQRFTATLINDFTLSGEIDQLIEVDDTLWIIDNKLIKHGKFEQIKKEGAYNEYALQVRAYKYLLQQYDHYSKYNIRMVLFLWFKDGTKFGKKPLTDYELYEIEDNFSNSEFEKEILYPKVLDLEESLVIPSENLEQCSNLFWNNRGKGEKSEPFKCMYFCDYNKYCPHYKKYNKGAGRKNLINLISKL